MPKNEKRKKKLLNLTKNEMTKLPKKNKTFNIS